MAQVSTAQLVVQLQNALKTAHLRAVFLFQCSTYSAAKNIDRLSQGYDNQLALGQTDDDTKAIPTHRYRDYLGATYDFVRLHFHDDLNYDALAAISGTVAGGGILCITLPDAGHPIGPSIKRLLMHAADYPLVQAVTLEHSFADALQQMLRTFPMKPGLPRAKLAYPSTEQQAIVNTLQAALPTKGNRESCTPQLLLADRGRGKSTCAGLAVKAALQSGMRFIVTAPRKSAATTLLRAAGGESGTLKFVAWDQLLRSQQQNPHEYLLIDEAGAIPQHILQRLLDHFQVWVMTTTVDGYEGAGRGFAIRLQRQLERTLGARTHQLSQPLRWSAADQLEPWLKQALLMQSSAATTDSSTVVASDTEALLASAITIHEVHTSQLNTTDLERVFTLLTNAHYQTSPNDLKLLLDDPRQKLLMIDHHNTCVAVAWLSFEGPLNADLRAAITRGERRPAGNLLPQSLAYFTQCEAALAHSWLRIVRVAVLEPYRRQHFGTRLLDNAYQIAQATGCVGIGTVFGGDDALLKFWQASGFQLARQSSKMNMASGYAAVTMIKLLDEHPCDDLAVLNAAQTFAAHERQWRQDGRIPKQLPAASFGFAKHLLRSFRTGILPFDICHFAFLICSQHAFSVTLPRTLVAALEKPIGPAEVAKQGGYASQKALVQTLQSMLKKEF